MDLLGRAKRYAERMGGAERETLMRAVLYALGRDTWDLVLNQPGASCDTIRGEIERAERLRKIIGDAEVRRALDEYISEGRLQLRLCESEDWDDGIDDDERLLD